MHGGSYGWVAKLVAEIRFPDEAPFKIRFSDDTNCKVMRRVIVPWPTVAARRSSSLDSGTNEKARSGGQSLPQHRLLIAAIRSRDEAGSVFTLGGATVGTHRADQRRAALRAAVSDVFEIAECSTIDERCGLNIRDRHPLSAMWTREDETRQVRRGDVHVTHGTLTVPIPPRHFATDLWNESTNTKVYASCIAGAGAGAGR
jgi:hypothetical protein